MSYVVSIESSQGRQLPLNAPCNALPGEILDVRYDLERVKREIARDSIAAGPASLWRYAALLPVNDPHAAVSLGEGLTPLLSTPRLARALGLRNLAVKDEGLNPSGTFKDRGAAVAISRYVELGVKAVAHNSSGNAGGSWSLYAARAGITCVNVLPTDVQPASLQHCRASGQPAFLVEKWHEANRMVSEACERNGWHNICTLKEPYRLEGKKTMGLEIAEQLGWKMPAAIFYPMGGGLGALAIWKAFEELLQLGWIEGRLPRLYVTQFEGCAPVVAAFDEGRDSCTPWGKIDIPPGGLRSPNPPGGRAVLALMRKHGGAAIGVSTHDAFVAVDELARQEGIFACPESATTIAGLRKALDRGLVRADEQIVVVSTGSGLKSIPSFDTARFPTVTRSEQIEL